MQRSLAAPFPMFAAQARTELLRLIRIPAFTATSLALPIMFYAFFGIANAHAHYGHTLYGLFILASFAAYSAMSIALFSFGVSVAAERGTGAVRLMRATPLRPSAYFFGKVVCALVFAAIAISALVLFAKMAGGVSMPFSIYLTLVTRMLAGSIPFIILGFAVGYLTSMSSAVAVLNLLILPLSFGSGLFVPLPYLPKFVQTIAPYLPTYHFGQLAWSVFGANQEPLTRAIVWLIAYGIVFLAVALRAYYREERKEFV